MSHGINLAAVQTYFMIHPMYAAKQLNLATFCLIAIMLATTLLPIVANAQNNLTESAFIIEEADQLS